ncbi:hypothetical protein WME97_09130 [Sorangium sp. So ce367]|uniref:hypothetical protein n=1 Tax=Sorangium sp. So ce367 TaxID=3133305 RepID=UPI003F5DE92C
MSAGSTIMRGLAVVVVATVVSSPLCFALPCNDGAGLFALPAPRVARVSRAAAPPGVPEGSGWLPARVARALSRTVERVARSGVAPMFLGLHGFGVTVSGEM